MQSNIRPQEPPSTLTGELTNNDVTLSVTDRGAGFRRRRSRMPVSGFSGASATRRPSPAPGLACGSQNRLLQPMPAISTLASAGEDSRLDVSRSACRWPGEPEETLRTSAWSTTDRMNDHNAPVVLVVDDEMQIRRFLRAGLELDGYVVQEATSGHEALKIATLRAVDLIILDLALPDIDGSEVLERVRSWSNVPVIVLSVRVERR